MLIRIRELGNLQKWHDCENMRKTAESLFGGIVEKEINSNTETHGNSLSVPEELS